jgi:replicative DNA helicase
MTADSIEARVLPHDLRAERAVLGAVLVRNDVLFDVLEHLTAAEFFRDVHRTIFRAMLALSEQKVPIDDLTLCEALTRTGELEDVGGPVYVAGLMDGVPKSTNAAAYAAIVRDKCTLRRLILAAHTFIAAAYEAEEAPATIVDAAQAALFDVASRQVRGGFIGTKTLMPQVLEAVEARIADKRRVTGVATGFTDLDDMTRGFQPGDLIIVAGRPSMGKTSFGMNVVQHAAIKDRRRAAVFSLEMNSKSLGLRLLASEARVDHHRVLSGQVLNADWGRMSMAFGRLTEAGILIDDSSTATVFDVRAKARRLKADGGLDLIVIDYLQLMTGVGKSENKNLEVAAITKALKAVARDLEVPIVLLSQLSREPDKRGNHRPMLSDLRDSGAIEQDADVVIMIHREEKYGPTDENRGIAEAILSKQRNGPTGSVRLVFHDHLVRFDNADRRPERTPYAGAPA